MHLKVGRVFVVNGRKFGRTGAGNDQIHGSQVARTFFYDVHRFLNSWQAPETIEPLDKVKNLFRTYPTCLANAHTPQFAIENKYTLTINKRHVVLNPDTLVTKRAAGMSQQ